MNVVFPKVTKCTFHKYGPSGTVTRHDGLCIPSLRVSVICARALNQVPRSTVKALISSKSGWLDQVGDYWVIYLLSKNLNPIAMKELLEELKPVMAPATNIYKPAYPEMDEKESPM